MGVAVLITVSLGVFVHKKRRRLVGPYYPPGVSCCVAPISQYPCRQFRETWAKCVLLLAEKRLQGGSRRRRRCPRRRRDCRSGVAGPPAK